MTVRFCRTSTKMISSNEILIGLFVNFLYDILKQVSTVFLNKGAMSMAIILSLIMWVLVSMVEHRVPTYCKTF